MEGGHRVVPRDVAVEQVAETVERADGELEIFDMDAVDPLAEDFDPVRRPLLVVEDVADIEIGADGGIVDAVDERGEFDGGVHEAVPDVFDGEFDAEIFGGLAEFRHGVAGPFHGFFIGDGLEGRFPRDDDGARNEQEGFAAEPRDALQGAFVEFDGLFADGGVQTRGAASPAHAGSDGFQFDAGLFGGGLVSLAVGFGRFGSQRAGRADAEFKCLEIGVFCLLDGVLRGAGAVAALDGPVADGFDHGCFP